SKFSLSFRPIAQIASRCAAAVVVVPRPSDLGCHAASLIDVASSRSPQRVVAPGISIEVVVGPAAAVSTAAHPWGHGDVAEKRVAKIIRVAIVLHGALLTRLSAKRGRIVALRQLQTSRTIANRAEAIHAPEDRAPPFAGPRLRRLRGGSDSQEHARHRLRG